MKNILETINCPNDIKHLNIEQLTLLASEIRKYLIGVVSETGGHLSSNLGVVELTIALHYVFDSPQDKMIWDVGHQSYIHKILTGRRESLKTIRQFNGLSGFTKRSESEHDFFDVGHSSTSISAALGYAVSRDMAGEDNAVIAIMGDGALTAGMSMEALNNGAELDSNFIVILNDNQMSIAENVGGLAQYLDNIRTGYVYKEIKSDVHKVLDKMPYVGKPITKAVKEIKEGIKQMLVPGMFFEEIGYTYLGPVDGHSLEQTIKVLKQARKINGPVLVHINTTKGKGYHFAEKNPSKYHGVKPFESKNGVAKACPSSEMTYSQIVGEKLSDYGMADKDIVAITAAMPDGTGLATFAKKYPNRFFDVGIAEQHAVTFSAGLALNGIKPFVVIYSTFLQRAYDQILHDVCIQKVPVVFLIDRAGIVGEDGETHQGVFDLSYLMHMPNISIMAPRDSVSFRKLLDYSLEYKDGPIAIRYPKGIAPILECGTDNEVSVGRSDLLYQGDNIAILAVGSMMKVALEIREKLSRENIAITVVDAVSIKPIDYEMIKHIRATHTTMITIEENALIGGFGSQVLRCNSESDKYIKTVSYGIKDEFVPHGSREILLKSCGLDADAIINDLRKQSIIK